MIIRNYRSSDCREILDIFYRTVHTINAADYTQLQLNAWASGHVDRLAWDSVLSAHDTVVAVVGEQIVGFGDMDPTGYFDRLFVHESYQRCGIASAICDELEKRVKASEIVTYASITALPFFVDRGYRVIRERQVCRRGVMLVQYVLEKQMR